VSVLIGVIPTLPAPIRYAHLAQFCVCGLREARNVGTCLSRKFEAVAYQTFRPSQLQYPDISLKSTEYQNWGELYRIIQIEGNSI